MEFVPRQRTTNTGNKEIEKIRKKPEEFEEKIRKPFFKKLNASDFYSKTPFLSIAEELLLAFRENLIKKTVIITTTYGIDNRKKKVFDKTFGNFPADLKLDCIGNIPREKRKNVPRKE